MLAVGQSYLGTYDSTIGLPGAGGVRATISLQAGGAYEYRNVGCFCNVIASGEYRMGPGFVILQPPSSGRAWEKARRFRVVWEKGDAYLLEDDDLAAFREFAAKGELKGSSFFVRLYAPMSRR